MHTVVLADLPPITSSISIVDVISLLVLPFLLPAVVGWVTNANWPVLNKRLLLGGLSLVTTLLTDIVEAAATGAPYDIGWGLLHFAAAWFLAEKAYQKILKAPIEVATPVEAQTEVTNLKKLTKDELIQFIEAPATIMTTVSGAGKSLASIIQSKGKQ